MLKNFYFYFSSEKKNIGLVLCIEKNGNKISISEILGDKSVFYFLNITDKKLLNIDIDPLKIYSYIFSRLTSLYGKSKFYFHIVYTDIIRTDLDKNFCGLWLVSKKISLNHHYVELLKNYIINTFHTNISKLSLPNVYKFIDGGINGPNKLIYKYVLDNFNSIIDAYSMTCLIECGKYIQEYTFKYKIINNIDYIVITYSIINGSIQSAMSPYSLMIILHDIINEFKESKDTKITFYINKSLILSDINKNTPQFIYDTFFQNLSMYTGCKLNY